jgi:hypothetical protein
MPVHDWTLVEAGIFHDFHSAWLTELRNALNGGLLPGEYYALSEQHMGVRIADLLTLHPTSTTPRGPARSPHTEGGVTVAEAPPQTQRKLTLSYRTLRRTLAIRHVSGHRLVALLEIVSPANKDRRDHVFEFVRKIREALEQEIHVVLLDLFPPGLHDPHGLPGEICDILGQTYELPADKPLTLASFAAGQETAEVYVENLGVGSVLPEMPLFLHTDRYIALPLEGTYQAAYRGVPAFWRHVLEGNVPTTP